MVTEGRESGTVGLFDPDGQVRADVVDAVVAGVGVGRRSSSRRRARISRPGSSAASAPDVEPREHRPGRGPRAGGPAARAARGHLRTPTAARRAAEAAAMTAFPEPLPRGLGRRRRRPPGGRRRCARCSPAPPRLPAHEVRRRARSGGRHGAGRGAPDPDGAAVLRGRRRRAAGRPRRDGLPGAPGRRHRRPERSWSAAAAGRARRARCVVVEGRYGHVSFVLDARPVLRVHVARRRPAVAGEAGRPGRAGAARPPTTCPPIEAVPRVVELTDLLPAGAIGHVPAAVPGRRHGRAGCGRSPTSTRCRRSARGLDPARLRAVPRDPRRLLRRRRCRRSTPARAPWPRSVDVSARRGPA